MRRLSIPPAVDRALFVLEEFADRASRTVDFDENGGFTIARGGSTAPPPSGVQRRYQGAEAPWAKLAPEDVASLRTSEEPTRAAARRLGVSPKTVRSARQGVTYVTQSVRPRCPACGAEWNMPNQPKVPGCLPSCRLYGRRLPEPPTPPFAAAPLPTPPKTSPKGKGESGHAWHDATPMLDRVRAWERLERACDQWAQHRDQAVRGSTSTLSLLQIESEMELATRELRKLRGG